MASEEETEAEFVARLVARDEGAFNELVLAYERRVFALVFRMVGRREEAEDVAQEVFVHVFKAIDQFRGEAKLATWLYRIAMNLCRNRLEYLKHRRHETRGDADEISDKQAGTGVIAGSVRRPDELYEGMQLEALIRRCFAQVDPDFREVIVLRDVEDLSYEEIAEVTGLPLGTVRSRIHRGRAQLRALVEEALGEKKGKAGK